MIGEYHINYNGLIKRCKCKDNECLFGGEMKHFYTKPEAMKYLYKMNKYVESQPSLSDMVSKLKEDKSSFYHKIIKSEILNLELHNVKHSNHLSSHRGERISDLKHALGVVETNGSNKPIIFKVKDEEYENEIRESIYVIYINGRTRIYSEELNVFITEYLIKPEQLISFYLKADLELSERDYLRLLYSQYHLRKVRYHKGKPEEEIDKSREFPNDPNYRKIIEKRNYRKKKFKPKSRIDRILDGELNVEDDFKFD